MNLYLNGLKTTAQELAFKFDEIGELDVIELVMVDEDGDLWYEVNTYGVQV